MTVPTITLYPDTLPAKEQANAPFDTNIDNFMTWLTATNGPELVTMINYTNTTANSVLAAALAGDLPPLTGNAGFFVAVNPGETAAQFVEITEIVKATQAEAQAGTNNATYMTPLRGKEQLAANISADADFTVDPAKLAVRSVLDAKVTTAINAIPSVVAVISQTDISTAVATVPLTGFSASDYTSYEIELCNVTPASDNVKLRLRTSSDGGSSYDDGSNDYAWLANGSRVGTVINEGTETDSFAELGTGIGSGGGEDGVTGTIRISRPDLAKLTQINTHISYKDASARFTTLSGSAQRSEAADVDGIQLSFSAGNIESGTIILRGFK